MRDKGKTILIIVVVCAMTTALTTTLAKAFEHSNHSLAFDLLATGGLIDVLGVIVAIITLMFG